MPSYSNDHLLKIEIYNNAENLFSRKKNYFVYYYLMIEKC